MLIFILVTLGCASASDINETDEIVALEDTISEVSTDNEVGTFTELNNKINQISPTEVVELTKDYTYDETTDTDDSGIILTSNTIINGNGHTINANNKARIFNVKTGPVTIENTIFINAKYTDGGGAINADKTSIILRNCTFISNQGKLAGAVYAKSVTIENCTFIKNRGTNSVGAVSAENGVVTDSKFSENEGSTIGALRLEKGKTFNSEFIKNKGGWTAGAIYYQSGSTTENCIFIGNRVYNDVFAFGEGSGAISQLYRDPQRIVNCTFINNTDNDADGNVSDYIYNNELRNRFLIKNDATIINCTFVNTKIICRYTEAYFSTRSFQVLFENNTFINSKINLTDGIASFSKNTFEGGFISNNATIASPTYLEIPNYVQRSENTLILARMTDDAGNTIFDNGTIKDCFKFLVNDEEFDSIKYVKINDIWFYQVNTTLPEGHYSVRAVLTNQTGLKQYYANCTLISGTLRVADVANFTELENEIRTQGNIITLEKDYALYITDEFGYSNGIVIDSDNVIIDGKGHSISGSNLARIFNIVGNNVTLRNITFENGKAYSGGAIIASSKITLEDCRFINNHAINGGATYLSDGNIINCQFIKNTASENGGAICLDEGNISNSEFLNNSAENGGAICLNNGNIINTNAANNSATNGGAIYINSGNIAECKFSDNDAVKNGGAVYITDGNITDCQFNHNNAESGAAAYLINNVDIARSSFTNNTAKNGVLVVETMLTMTNCTFENNTLEDKRMDIQLIGNGEAVLENITPKDIKAKHIVVLSGYASNVDFGTPACIEIYVKCEGMDVNEGTVKFSINNGNYTGNVENNYASIIIPNLNPGYYKVNVTYDGGDKYSEATTTLTFFVYQKESRISATEAKFIITKGGMYTAMITDTNGNPIANGQVLLGLIIDNYGITIGENTSDANGVVSFAITPEVIENMTLGRNQVIVFFTGSEEYGQYGAPSFITLAKDNVQINANGISTIINYASTYSITLKDNDGNVISGESVTFTLNGKNIGTVKTDSNGAATITLTASMLKAAKYGSKNLVISFNGNNYYNANSKTVKVTIKKEAVKITAKKKTFKKSVKVKKYTITLKNSKGKAIKKAKVTLKIKGKTYTAKTNTKGKTTFKIKKLTKKGKYTAKIAFKTTALYLKATKKVKITIK